MLKYQIGTEDIKYNYSSERANVDALKRFLFKYFRILKWGEEFHIVKKTFYALFTFFQIDIDMY